MAAGFKLVLALKRRNKMNPDIRLSAAIMCAMAIGHTRIYHDKIHGRICYGYQHGPCRRCFDRYPRLSRGHNHHKRYMNKLRRQAIKKQRKVL